MDSWMKRGFLLKDPEPSMSIAAKEVTTAGGAACPANKPREPFKIPPVPFEYDDDVPENSGRPHVGKVVMIPTPLPSSGPGPYTLSLLYPGAREAIEALPGFPTPYSPSIRVHYRIGDAPGTSLGKGMFALTDFNLGDLILRERPICLFPEWFAGNNDASEEYAMSILSQLKPDDFGDFFDLANCRTGENIPSGIMNTNSLYAGFIPGEYHGEYACICRDLCRVNHSCRPNAVYRWRLKDMVYELRALFPIKEGEQIFVSYLDNLQTRSARRTHLRSAYGFICNCPACAIPTSDISFRDNLRELLALTVQLDKANDDSVLNAWLEDSSLPDDHVIAQSMEIIKAMNVEGLIDRDICNGHYPRLVKAYCTLKDMEKAKFWAERLALTLTAIYGHDYGWNKVADAPELTDWWGLRKKA